MRSVAVPILLFLTMLSQTASAGLGTVGNVPPGGILDAMGRILQGATAFVDAADSPAADRRRIAEAVKNLRGRGLIPLSGSYFKGTHSVVLARRSGPIKPMVYYKGPFAVYHAAADDQSGSIAEYDVGSFETAESLALGLLGLDASGQWIGNNWRGATKRPTRVLSRRGRRIRLVEGTTTTGPIQLKYSIGPSAAFTYRSRPSMFHGRPKKGWRKRLRANQQRQHSTNGGVW